MGDFARAGASQITFHYEAGGAEGALRTIALIKQTGLRAALAIKPGTGVAEVAEEVLAAVDMVLVMTVEPGFGGQTLIPACLDKVRRLRRQYPRLDIQVDGGITLENLAEAVAAGANIFVAGSLIFGSPDPHHTIASMQDILIATVGQLS